MINWLGTTKCESLSYRLHVSSSNLQNFSVLVFTKMHQQPADLEDPRVPTFANQPFHRTAGIYSLQCQWPARPVRASCEEAGRPRRQPMDLVQSPSPRMSSPRCSFASRRGYKEGTRGGSPSLGDGGVGVRWR